MRKSTMSLLVVTMLLGSLLTACSGNANPNNENQVPAPPPISDGSNQNGEAGTDIDPPAEPEDPQEPEQPEQPDEQAPASSTDNIVNELLERIEQPGLYDLTPENLKDFYDLDPDMLAEFTIKTPAINLMSNEIAVIKVKDAKDMDAIKSALEQRATVVQQMFEHYLPNPYKYAQDYRISVSGDYVLFLISESADELEEAFKDIIIKYNA